MNLPNEILHVIFKNLTQRYLRHCPQVCRAWHQVAQPLLYESVELYSYQQLSKFIETRLQYNDTANGNCTQTIRFYFDFGVDNASIASLQQVCPNVKTVFSEPGCHIQGVIRPSENWQVLATLTVNPLEDSNELWHSKADQLMKLVIAPSESSHLPVLRLDNFMPAALLSSLTELTIGFNQIIQSPDVAFFNYLSLSCPSLTTLILTDLYFTEKNKVGTFSEISISPINSVTTFRTLFDYSYTRTHLYEYYTRAFPNLTHLDLKIGVYWKDNETEATTRAHQMALYTLVTGFPYLSSLHVGLCPEHLYYTTSMAKLFPTTLIEEWLVSVQLVSFSWPDYRYMGLGLGRYNCLNHLTCLTIDMPGNFALADLLRTLLFNNTRTTIPTQLAKLEINAQLYVNDTFDLAAWSSASQQLKELVIKGLDIVDHNNSSDKDMYFFPKVHTLKMMLVRVQLDGALTNLTKYFPALKHIDCAGMTWYDKIQSDTIETDGQPLMIMDTPHLELDCFYFSRKFAWNEVDYIVTCVDFVEGDGSKSERRVLLESPSPLQELHSSLAISLVLKSVNRLAFDIPYGAVA